MEADPTPDCGETLRELYSFLDDELTDETRRAIHHHLEGCPDCFSAFDFHAELKQVISVKCQGDEMPDGLLDRLQQCLSVPLDAPAPADDDPVAGATG